MQLDRRTRSKLLRPFVDTLCYSESRDVGFERVLPSGRTTLMVNLAEDRLWAYDPNARRELGSRGIALTGPELDPRVIDTSRLGAVISVVFTHGGARAFFDVPMSEVTGTIVDLPALWGVAGSAFRERLLDVESPSQRLDLLERLLLERLRLERLTGRADHGEPESLLTSAVAAVHRGLPIAGVREVVGLSPKRLIRLFSEQVGMTPKRFARICRFQRVLASVAARGSAGHAVDWATVALDHGFADQAHLCSDFRELGGITPSSYRPASPHAHNHLREIFSKTASSGQSTLRS